MLCPERLAGRTGRGNRPRAGAHPPHPSASPPAASRIGPGAPRGASLPRRCGQPVGVGFSAVSPMASLASPSRCQQQVSAQQAQAPSRSALRAREALVRSAPRCRAGEPPAPYQRRCITGALHHHLRDRVRQVRSPHRLHEQRCCPLGHFSLDASGDSEPCLLDQLPAGPGCHRAPRHGQPSSTQRSGPWCSRQPATTSSWRLPSASASWAVSSPQALAGEIGPWIEVPVLRRSALAQRSVVGATSSASGLRQARAVRRGQDQGIRPHGNHLRGGTIGEGEPWRSWSPPTCCCWPVR